jgi:hypothetical protein
VDQCGVSDASLTHVNRNDNERKAHLFTEKHIVSLFGDANGVPAADLSHADMR